jgi:hypothetical protein
VIKVGGVHSQKPSGSECDAAAANSSDCHQDVEDASGSPSSAPDWSDSTRKTRPRANHLRKNSLQSKRKNSLQSNRKSTPKDRNNGVAEASSPEAEATGRGRPRRESSGNIRRDSENIRPDLGNIRRDSGNVRRDSGNMRRRKSVVVTSSSSGTDDDESEQTPKRSKKRPSMGAVVEDSSRYVTVYVKLSQCM